MVADECAAAAATAVAGAAPELNTPCGAPPVSGVVKSSVGGEDCVVGALVPCVMAAAMRACAAAPVSAGDEAPSGVVLPRAAALLSFEVGADVAAAMFALTEVPSLDAVPLMDAAPSAGLAGRAASAEAAGTRAAGADALAALPDKTETGAVVVPAASGAVMENPGGMPGAPAAGLPASPSIRSPPAAATVAGGGAMAAGGVESPAMGWPLAGAPRVPGVPSAANVPALAWVAGAASVLAGGGGVTASGG
jgi:hypothetical protein